MYRAEKIGSAGLTMRCRKYLSKGNLDLLSDESQSFGSVHALLLTRCGNRYFRPMTCHKGECHDAHCGVSDFSRRFKYTTLLWLGLPPIGSPEAHNVGHAWRLARYCRQIHNSADLSIWGLLSSFSPTRDGVTKRQVVSDHEARRVQATEGTAHASSKWLEGLPVLPLPIVRCACDEQHSPLVGGHAAAYVSHHFCQLILRKTSIRNKRYRVTPVLTHTISEAR